MRFLRLTPPSPGITWIGQIVHSFVCSNDGDHPWIPLQFHGGKFYGSTYDSGGTPSPKRRNRFSVHSLKRMAVGSSGKAECGARDAIISDDAHYASLRRRPQLPACGLEVFPALFFKCILCRRSQIISLQIHNHQRVPLA